MFPSPVNCLMHNKTRIGEKSFYVAEIFFFICVPVTPTGWEPPLQTASFCMVKFLRLSWKFWDWILNPEHFSYSAFLLSTANTKEKKRKRPENPTVTCCSYLHQTLLINISAVRVSHVSLFPVVVIAAEAAETEAWNHFGGGKFMAQWHPLCRWHSHFPKRISCLSSLLYWSSCLKFSHSQGQYNGCNLM